MKDVLKKEYKAIILVAAYILIAELVYITISVIFLKQWYFHVLIGFGVLAIGLLIGFFYVISEYKKHKEAEIKPKEEALNPAPENINENN